MALVKLFSNQICLRILKTFQLLSSIFNLMLTFLRDKTDIAEILKLNYLSSEGMLVKINNCL